MPRLLLNPTSYTLTKTEKNATLHHLIDLLLVAYT